ncbi:kinase-like domain-containing protein [Dipodascopsis tothii]|uniref:kinase-like domain-containing protein n=1 Tax=Dipodascopsis tothii TaxID=44089 RepID=UPI0034CDA068
MLLVLPYCRGGDLFDLASRHRDVLTPRLVKRIFAELASAVHYIHANNIVHRDIKLENVLLTLPPSTLAVIGAPERFPSAIATLSDFGLSREIDPAHPLLSTRCGSEDYAAPEIIMGQPYDGRATDVWALGVLLYALVEGRLPFDSRAANGRNRVKHRIARVDWAWAKITGVLSNDWADPKLIVEGCLRRKESRVTMDHICASDAVRDSIAVPLFQSAGR